MEFEIDSCNQCSENLYKSNNIHTLDQNLTYNDFFKGFMQPNNLCIIKDVTQTWEANSKWLTDDGKPNLQFLKNRYGSCNVTLYNCNERYYNSQQTEKSTLKFFLDKFWGVKLPKLKYLKDWHLKNTFREDNFYEVPIYFASDWLNEFLVENSDDDYRFVYMGQAETWTPFHADVFNSYSWSANLCGRKKWVLFPPGEEEPLRDHLGNLPYDIGEIYYDIIRFELVQNPGEAIFVPSGWYHQVWNLEDTISVNHNWVNGCNIEKMWYAIENNLKRVKKEIEDCKDMENFINHCQIMLDASFGMDFYKFYNFITFIGQRRLAFLQKRTNGTLFHGHVIGLNHAVFDLKAVQLVLEKFLQHSDVRELFITRDENPGKILEEITQFLNSTNVQVY